MPYGTPLKTVTSNLNYLSHNSEYLFDKHGHFTRDSERVIRTGNNHSAFINPDGDLVEYIKTTRWVNRIIGFDEIRRRKRYILGSREVGGKPIYKYLTSSDPSGSGKRKKVIVGYSPKKLRYIYTYRSYTYKRPIWKKIPKITYVKRVRRVTSAPILHPNALHYQSYKSYGLDAASMIVHAGRFPDHLGAVCTTYLNGVINGTLNLEFSPAFGYDATTRALFMSPTVGIVQLELEDRALFKLNSNAQGSAAKLSQMMAERAQIKATIGSLCVDVLGTLLRGKRAIVSGVVDVLSDPRKIANTYLAYVYGIKPILSDLQASYNEIIHREDAWFRCKGIASREWVELSTARVSDFCTVEIKEEYLVVVKQQVCMTGTSCASRFLSSHGLTNAASVVWEVMPWSFVVDWFLPIGSWLAQPDAFEGSTVASWHTTLIRKKKTTINVRYHGFNSGYDTIDSNDQLFYAENFYCDRTIKAGTPPLAQLRFKNPIGIQHAANSLFLICQQILK